MAVAATLYSIDGGNHCLKALDFHRVRRRQRWVGLLEQVTYLPLFLALRPTHYLGSQPAP